MWINFCDSDSDVTLEWCKEHNFEMISMPYSIDGKEVKPYVDFTEFDAKKFYNLLREGVLPNTSAISKDDYIRYFEPHFAAGNDIFYIHFSRKMSTSFNAMDEAVEELKAKYPGRKFLDVDTKGITTVTYAVLNECASRLESGMSVEEVCKWGNENAEHFAMYFFVEDLKFFKHSGRVSGLAATMGTIIGVRPIIHMNSDGVMVNVGKAIGRVKAIESLMSYVDQLGDHVKDYTIRIGHTDADELVNEIIAKLKEKFGDDVKIDVRVVCPTIGAHCGPNGVGICFHSVHR